MAVETKKKKIFHLQNHITLQHIIRPLVNKYLNENRIDFLQFSFLFLKFKIL